jgi:hypothetical protein
MQHLRGSDRIESVSGVPWLTKGTAWRDTGKHPSKPARPLTIALTAPRSDLPNLLVVSHDVGPVLMEELSDV